MRRRPVLLLLLLLAAAAAAPAAPAPAAAAAGLDAAGGSISELVTGEEAAHELGLDGAGVLLGIIDSSFNTRHLAFGGCAGGLSAPGCRVKKFSAAAGSTPGTAATPAAGGCESEFASHGTAVASLAAGFVNGTGRGGRPWHGVAPGASILAYDIGASPCQAEAAAGLVASAAALGAVRAATADGADVVNLSFGPGFGGPSYPDAELATALTGVMQAGSLAVISSGNEGTVGPFATEAAVAAPGVISVASVATTLPMPGPQLVLLGLQPGSKQPTTLQSEAILLSAPAYLTDAQQLLRGEAGMRAPLQVVPTQPPDACAPALANAGALRGKVALVVRGACAFTAKVAAAAAAGAAAVIVLNDDDNSQLLMKFEDTPRIPVWGLQQTRPGEALRRAASSAGGALLLAVKRVSSVDASSIVVTPSPFSSWGPPATLEMSPTLSAPGEVVKAAAEGVDGFDYESGTSFAAPWVAGALALWRQSRPALPKTGTPAAVPNQTWDQAVAAAAKQALAGPAAQPTGGFTNQAAAYAAFVSTARPIEWRERKGWAQPVSRVGAGLIQVDAAIQNPTTLVPNHLLLRSNRPSQTVTVTAVNAARYPVTYKLSHMPAAAVALGSYTWFELDPTSLLRPLAADVTLKVAGKAATHLTLPPGGRADIQVVLALPRTLSAGPYLYSGYVRLVPTTTAADKAPGPGASVPLAPVPLVVPYQGYSQNFTTAPMLPQPLWQAFPQASSKLASLLRLCYARVAATPPDPSSEPPANQDGRLDVVDVDACISAPASNAPAVQKLSLQELQLQKRVLAVVAALVRPAQQAALMLLEPGCGVQADTVCAKGAGSQQQAAVVGALWSITHPSRDAAGTLYAMYGEADKAGRVAVPDGAAGHKQVAKQRPYRMQLWITGPVAAADQAAGEQAYTFKFDVPGTFVFV